MFILRLLLTVRLGQTLVRCRRKTRASHSLCLSLSLSFREPFSRRRYFSLLSFLSKARRYVQESSKKKFLFFLCSFVSRSNQSKTILIEPCEFFKRVKTHVCNAISSVFGSTICASVFETIQTLTFNSKILAGLFRR